MERKLFPFEKKEVEYKSAELGTRQFFSFTTTTTRQRKIASRTMQGPKKSLKIVRPQCLDGVTTTNIVKWKLQTTLCPEYMVIGHIVTTELLRAQLCTILILIIK